MISREDHDGVRVLRLCHGKVSALDIELGEAFTAQLQTITPFVDTRQREVREAVDELRNVAEVAQRAAAMARREIERPWASRIASGERDLIRDLRALRGCLHSQTQSLIDNPSTRGSLRP